MKILDQALVAELQKSCVQRLARELRLIPLEPLVDVLLSLKFIWLPISCAIGDVPVESGVAPSGIGSGLRLIAETPVMHLAVRRQQDRRLSTPRLPIARHPVEHDLA